MPDPKKTTPSTPDPSKPAPEKTAVPAAAPAPEVFLQQLNSITGKDAKEALAELISLIPGSRVAMDYGGKGMYFSGMAALDASRPKTFREFLTSSDPDQKAERRRLAERLKVYKELLAEAENSADAKDLCQTKHEEAEALLDRNLSSVMEALQPLETTYRMLDAFYANAEREPGDKIDAWIFNAEKDALLDPNDRELFDKLARKIQEEFRSFTMRKTYGILVVPGWAEDVKAIDRLADLGHQNKVMVLSDGPDFESFERLNEFLDSPRFGGLRDVDPKKRNIALFVNYLLVRPRYSFEGEDKDLFVPPSLHLAGAMIRNDHTKGIHQPVAGWRYGKLMNAEVPKFRVFRDTANTLLSKYGVNAIADIDGYCTVVGDTNLSSDTKFNGYARIRTEDWICKNILNYLNYQIFQTITTSNLQRWKEAIYDFLRSIQDRQGDERPIRDFKVEVISSDEDRVKKIVRVNLRIDYLDTVRYFYLSARQMEGDNKALDSETSSEKK